MKVLLGTDGSEQAEQSAWLLSHLPHEATLELSIVCVLKPVEVRGSPSIVKVLEEQAAQDKERVLASCKRIEQMFEGANAKVQIHIREGHPGKELIDAAQELEVDLIIVGATGHSLISRILLGSVSDFVATHAPCSVLVVRPTGLQDREHGELNVCLAFDDSEPCRFAIDQLSQFGWRKNTRLNVVGVLSLPFNFMNEPIEFDPTPLRQALQESVEEAAESLSQMTPDAEPHVIEGVHVGECLVQFAKKQNADLIVLGNTGFGLVTRFLLGSVSRFVLRNANCSVWIARSKQ